MPDELTKRLWWSDDGDEARVLVGPEDDREPLLSFQARGHRLSMRMVMLDGRRLLDASFHPAVAAQLLQSHARHQRANADGWLGAVTTALLRFSTRHDLWSGGLDRRPDGRPSLTTLIGGMTHPVLGAAYEQGATSLEEIPRWASPMLSMPTVRDSARQAFGSSGTRRVAAALAAALSPTTNDSPHATPAMWPVAFAIAARHTCEPDHLVRILQADAPRRGPSEWPTRTTIAMVEQIAHEIPSRETASLFVEALETPDGTSELLKAARVFPQVKLLFDRTPPGRLDRFVRDCLAHASLDPGPTRRDAPRPEPRPRQRAAAPPPSARGGVAPPRRSSVRPTAAPQQRPADRRPRVVAPRLRPDPSRREFLDNDRFNYPAEVQALHEAPVGDHLLILPRSPDELGTWGHILKNCLAIYPEPIAAGRTVIFGIRRRETLIGAIEYRPDSRTIHQAESANGRPLDTNLFRSVAALLAEHRLTDTTPTITPPRLEQRF